MNYTTDPQFLVMIFLLPALFGFSLIGEGVTKTMNYDARGWVGIVAGSGFLLVIVLAYFLLSSNTLA